jgi:sulfide:quinone oxidoreductase
MPKHVVILGAGFAGLELAARLSASVPDEVQVTLIDQSDSFVFGYSKLDITFGNARADDLRLRYRDLAKPGVTFRQERVTSIEPDTRYVQTESASYDADILVVALGADYDPDATPGFREGGLEYYSVPGAERLRDALPSFEGGRVVIAVLGDVYKCPPAPFEGAFLLHDHLVQRGLRDRSDIRVMGPMDAPVPIAKEVTDALLGGMAERDIEFTGRTLVTRLDADRKVAEFADGGGVEYDLFIGIPRHRVPAVVEESGLAVDGWVPVDTTNLATRFPDVYALGDVAAAKTAKAGVFAEGAARAVADDIIGKLRGTGPGAPFDGAGNCYIEFGAGRVGKVEANFLGGPKPTGKLVGPSRELADEKVAFGSIRRERWFGG